MIGFHGADFIGILGPWRFELIIATILWILNIISYGRFFLSFFPAKKSTAALWPLGREGMEVFLVLLQGSGAVFFDGASLRVLCALSERKGHAEGVWVKTR